MSKASEFAAYLKAVIVPPEPFYIRRMQDGYEVVNFKNFSGDLEYAFLHIKKDCYLLEKEIPDFIKWLQKTFID